MLKERAPDLAATVVKLAEGYAERHRDSDDDQSLDNAARRLEKAYGEAKALAPDAESSESRDRFAKATGALHARASLVKRTRECVTAIKEAAAVKPAALAVRKVMAQVKEEKGRLVDIDKNSEVVEIVKQVYANHIQGVTYDEKEKTLAAAHRENDETTLRVNSLLRGAGNAPRDDPIVLALVRGVLYALYETTGRTKWALRVGVDATALPVRVPATEISPERILVPSADALTLAALDADGNRLWEYKLSDKCIGRPLVVGNLAYVPTYDGKVHEIELAQGKLKGVYDLGQHAHVGRRPPAGDEPALLPRRRLLRLRPGREGAPLRRRALHRPPRRLAARRTAGPHAGPRGRGELAGPQRGARPGPHAALRLPPADRGGSRATGAGKTGPGAAAAGLDVVPAVARRRNAGDARRHRRFGPIRHPSSA